MNDTDGILLTEQEAADLLALERDTLKRWRSQKKGPSYYRLEGRTIRYSHADLLAWRESQRVEAA